MRTWSLFLLLQIAASSDAPERRQFPSTVPFKRIQHSEVSFENFVQNSTENFCPICDRKLETPIELLSHQVEQSHFLDLFCPVCDSVPGNKRQFSSVAKLKRHITTVHLKTEGVKCCFCESSYTRIDSWKRHMVNSHTVYPCHMCKGMFSDPLTLKTHELTCRRKANTAAELPMQQHSF